MKTKTKKNSTMKLIADRPNGELARDEIALVAHSIWEQEGCPQGRDVEHWLQAETQLRQARNLAVVQA